MIYKLFFFSKDKNLLIKEAFNEWKSEPKLVTKLIQDQET